MSTMNSTQAVFLWTFRRKWKGFSIFIAATAVMIFAIISFYPDFWELLKASLISKELLFRA